MSSPISCQWPPLNPAPLLSSSTPSSKSRRLAERLQHRLSSDRNSCLLFTPCLSFPAHLSPSCPLQRHLFLEKSCVRFKSLFGPSWQRKWTRITIWMVCELSFALTERFQISVYWLETDSCTVLLTVDLSAMKYRNSTALSALTPGISNYWPDSNFWAFPQGAFSRDAKRGGAIIVCSIFLFTAGRKTVLISVK